MNNLSEILEICLQEIENGADIDTVLFRYPAFAQELRPVLEGSLKARELSDPAPSPEIVRRSRAKVLQHAARMREASARSSRRLWSVPLRRMLVSLAVILVLFMSSTGLVRAASTTLPGDNLYPVKRTWEDVLVLFTFDARSRQAREVEYENERLDELKELFTRRRSVEVEFSGTVTRLNGDLWLVAGVPVAISTQTELPTQAVVLGDALRVEGITQSDGAVLAREIELLPAGIPLPEVDDDEGFEFEQENSGRGSGEDEPRIDSSGSSSGSQPDEESLDGVVESINGNILVIGGQIVNLDTAEIEGTPRLGDTARMEGYYNPDGLFIVTRIEFESSSGPRDGNTSGSDDGNRPEDERNDVDHSGSGGGGD
jgi:hypothetical protein